MTLQLLHSEFPYIGGKFDFIFYQCGSFLGKRQGDMTRRQDRPGRTGHAGQDAQVRTRRTERAGQDAQDRTRRKGHAGKDAQDRTRKTGKRQFTKKKEHGSELHNAPSIK